MKIDVRGKLGKKVDIRWLLPFENNQVKAEEWDSADLRVLCVFLSTGTTRAVSNTFSSLNSLVDSWDKKAFFDYSYFPHKPDLEEYRNAGVPFIIGNVSNRTIEDYDLVIFSFSIIQEVTNIFALLRESGIPIYHKERLSDKRWPLFVAGGITIDAAEAMNGNSSVVDLIGYAQAEGTLLTIFDAVHESKDKLRTPDCKKYLIKKLVTENDWIYYPAGYEHTYSDDKTKILSIERRLDWVPEKVNYKRVYNMDDYPYFEKKIFTPDGSNATSADNLISMGCGGAGVCYFCHEGCLQGSWRELSFGELKKRLDTAKAWTAANSVSAYSFNLNYYSKFVDLIYEMASRFSHLSFINMRVDVLAECPEYLQIAKYLGVNRISAAVEGIGDRIRNKILNKNLPFDIWKKAMKNVFQQRFAEVKNGMVLTSLENDKDYDDGIREFTEIINMRNQMQVKTSLRQTFCTTDNCRIPVYKKGWLKPSEINSGDFLILGGTLHEVEETIDNGIKEIYRIETDKGSFIEGVDEHPVWSRDRNNWVLLKDLEIGESLGALSEKMEFGISHEETIELKIQSGKYSGQSNQSEFDYIAVNDRFAFILGWLVGDGYVESKAHRIGWVYRDCEMELEEKLKTFFGEYGYRYSITRREFEKGTERINYFRLNSKQLKDALIESGYSMGGAHGSRIPEVIWKSDVKKQALFLNALFTADGCFVDRGNRTDLYLTSASKELLEDVKIMLSGFSVLSSISLRSDKRSWNLRVSTRSLAVFFYRVGLAFHKNTTREFREWESITWTEDVTLVEMMGEERTFGFKIKGKRYNTNGILSHNTPAVIYDGVPMQWEPRESAMVSFNQEKRMRKWLDAMKELGIRVKFNGGGLGTWFQQVIIDYGRRLTPFLEEYSKDDSCLFYSDSVSVKKRDKLVDMLVQITGVHPTQILNQKRGEDWIFPSHTLLRTPPKLKKEWKETMGKGIKYCLKTSVNLDTACRNCGLCPSPEHKKFVTKRDLSSERQVPDISVAIYENNPVFATRVLMFVNKDYDTIGKQALSHAVTSQFLRQDEYLAKHFHSIKFYSARPLFENFQRDYLYGYVSFDILWKNIHGFQVSKSDVENRFKQLISHINTKLFTCQVKGFETVGSLSDPFRGATAIYMFDTSMPKEKLSSGLLTYDGQVKAADKSCSFIYTQIPLERKEFDVRAIPVNNKLTGVIRLPWKVNPYMLMYSLTRVSYWRVLQNTYMALFSIQNTNLNECACGRGFKKIEVLTNKAQEVCDQCYVDNLLSKIRK